MRESSSGNASTRQVQAEAKSLFGNIVAVSPCRSIFYLDSGLSRNDKLFEISILAVEREKNVRGNGWTNFPANNGSPRCENVVPLACDNLVRGRGKNMDQRMSDSVKSPAGEDHAERSVEEFERLSGQGNSNGWTFNREEIQERR